MGTLVCSLATRANTVGHCEVHQIKGVYKPTGRAIDDTWYRRYIEPSNRAWAKRSDVDRMNVLAHFGKKPVEGDDVYEVPTVDGRKMFDDDFGTQYKVVGKFERGANGKLFIHFKD